MFVKPVLIDEKKHPILFHDLPTDQQGKATLKLRDPRTKRLLAASGMEVPDIRFWHRRIIQGDVVLAIPSAVEQG